MQAIDFSFALRSNCEKKAEEGEFHCGTDKNRMDKSKKDRRLEKTV